MRYEDASQAGAMTGDVVARDDTDHLAGNDFGPAIGNLITGSGTVSGATGTDMVGPGGHITAIAGAGGSDTSFDADGKLEVAGQYGTLTIDAQGNYTYVRNPDSPEGVSDTFTYTLANEAGATDNAELVIAIGNPPILQAEGPQTVTTNDGVVVLPAGVELSDVRVVGRDLVITLPDGSTMVIPNGAVFVPQLVVNGVEVPAANLAALLIDAEPQPAAGDITPNQLSSGGNFALPPSPLDPGVPLGDLLPPTELSYTPPEFEEIGQPIEENDPPSIGASAINVSDEGVSSVNAPLPDNSGSPDTTNSRISSGTIPISDPDGDVLTVTLGTPPSGLTSQGTLIVWTVSPDGQTLTGTAGPAGPVVITVEIDSVSATGANYTVTQSQPIDHPNTGTEDGVTFVVPVSVSDGENPVVTGGSIAVTVEDDSPVVDSVTARGGVTLDESDADPRTPEGFPITGTTDGPIIAAESGEFGADGPAAANSIVYGLGLTGGVSSLASGMQTAQGNHEITLVQVDGDTIEGRYDGSNVAFIIQMNGDGSVTLTQNVPLEHVVDGPPGPAHDDSLSLDGLVTATVTYMDFDGDTASGSAPIGGNLIFKDDGPDAAVNEQAPLDTVVLDETRPEGTDTDDGSPVAGPPTGLASATINFADNFQAPDYGADGAGTVGYKLTLSANGIGSGLYALEADDNSALDGDGYGQGEEITLSINAAGTIITGSAGDPAVDYFTISINAETGIVTFTQLNPIWHPTPGDFDEQVTLATEAAGDMQVEQTVTDSDGDTDTATVDIGRGVFSIQDDGPDQFEECPDDVIAVNDVGATFTGGLNLPDVGEDEPGKVSFGVEDGDPVLDSEGDPISSNGQPLFYYVNDQGVLEARAGDENGDVIFTITINGDGTFTYNQLGPITSQTELSITDLSSVGGGNVEAKAIDVPDSPYDLILTTQPGKTVNTNANEMGVDTGNDMAVGEILRVDFVQDAFVTGSGGGAVLNFGEYYSANSYRQDVSGLGGPQRADFIVRAVTVVEAGGSDPSDPADGDSVFYGDTNDTFLAGTSLNLYDDLGNLVDPLDYAGLGITVTALADGWSITGLPNDYDFEITSNTSFNAVQIESLPTTDTFKLGIIDITTVVQSDVSLAVPIALTDADGDAVVCDIDILLGAPINVPDVAVTVDEAGLALIGSDSGSDSETQGGDLQGLISGGTGPYTFALVGSADGAYGTLTLNADGTFSYTLDTPFDSSPDSNDGTNVEPGVETFAYEATDSLGAKQTGTITINIRDDVPSAVDDTDNIAAGDYGPATGNVITDASAGDAGDSDDGADTPGADDAVVTGVVAGDTNANLDNPATVGAVIQGTYGKLTLNADGSYSYARDPGTDGGVQDVFTYTLKDGDGDLVNATLTISIADSPVTLDVPTQGEAGTSVDEKGLPERSGEPAGTGEAADGNGADNDDTSETTAGTITYTAPDGPAIVRIDGVEVTSVGQTFNGSHGVLTITSIASGSIGYSYTLTDNTSGNATFDDFAISVEDQDGDTDTGTLTVDIVDDTPIANNDVDFIEGGAGPATGNVITGVDFGGGDANGTDGTADNVGADDASITKIASNNVPANIDDAPDGGGDFVVVGEYGTLTINANGDYSYVRTDLGAGGVQDVFTYTLTDGDGDPVTATLTISIADNFPTAGNVNVQLDDDALAGGNVGGTDDVNPDTSGTNGNLPGSGGDGTHTFSVLLTGEPAGFDYVSGGAGILLIQQGGETKITVTVNADGSYTVVQNNPIDHPTPGTSEENVQFTVNYRVTDEDGDFDDGTISIDVDDDTPTINVTKAADAGVLLTTDDAQTIGIDTDTAQSTANFSDVFALTQSAGADGGAAATLGFTLDVAGYDGTNGVDSGLDQGGNTIYLHEIGGKVVGSTSATVGGVLPGNTVFDVAVSGTGVVTLSQYSQIDHPVISDPSGTGGPDYNDHIVSMADGLITLTASSTITDGDNDQASDSETVNIGANLQFTDDGPNAVNDGNLATLDDNASGVTIGTVAGILGNDSYGADGAATSNSITIGTGSLGGTVSIVGGNLVYTSAHNVAPGGNAVETFTYTITDFDGDTDTATFTVTLTDEGPSINSAAASIAVDEEGLTGGLAGTSYGDGSDLAGVATTQSGTLAGLDFGVDGPGDIVLTAVADTTLRTLANEVVKSHWDGTTHTLTGYVDTNGNNEVDGGETQVFTLQITDVATGAYTFTLLQPVKHATANTEDNATFNVGVTVTDAEGDPANGTISVLVDDDSPIAVSAAAITSGLSNGGGDSASANLDGGVGGNNIVADNFGADGGKVIFTAATVTALQGQNLKHNGTALEYTITGGGQLLTAYADTNNNDTVDGGETVFTIQLQPGGQPNDYVVTMVKSVDVVQNIDFNGGGYNFVGGNGSWAGFTSGTNGDGVLDLLLTPMVNGVNASTMNTNANEGGVGSGNSVALGEGVRVDTVQDLQAVPAPTPSGDYGTLANQNHVFGQHENVIGISAVISTVNGPPGSTTNIQMIARDESLATDSDDYVGDGAIEAITSVVITHGAVTTTVLKSGGANQNVVVDGISYNVVFGATDATVNGVVEGTRIGASTADGFDSLEFRNVGGQEFKIGDFNTLSISNGPLDFTAPITVIDGDGDTVASGNLAIHVDGGTPPVVLDLDGDGAEFLGLSAGVSYDYGAGMVGTAWVGPDDGILVRDANGNGLVDDASEFVFGGNGITDLEALHAMYGEQLDASDADFTMFAVWNDANSNGAVDANELQSLAEAGIVSISLVSDGIAYSAANGDVQVAGTASFTRADGSIGDAADALFSTGSWGQSAQEVERVAANSNSVALAAAVAAAGVVASAPAAAYDLGDAPFTGITNAVAGREAYDSGLDAGSASTTFAIGNAWNGGFDFGAMSMASTSYGAIAASHIGELTAAQSIGNGPTAPLEATDFAALMQAPAMGTGLEVAMASIETLVPQEASVASDVNAKLGSIVQDALQGGGSGPDLDALLNALPGAGLGENAGLHGLASLGGANVPTWDTGHAGGFTFDPASIITTEATALHHDAVQPVANG